MQLLSRRAMQRCAQLSLRHVCRTQPPGSGKSAVNQLRRAHAASRVSAVALLRSTRMRCSCVQNTLQVIATGSPQTCSPPPRTPPRETTIEWSAATNSSARGPIIDVHPLPWPYESSTTLLHLPALLAARRLSGSHSRTSLLSGRRILCRAAALAQPRIESNMRPASSA